MADLDANQITVELLKQNMRLADANEKLAERVSRLEVSHAASNTTQPPATAAPAATGNTGFSSPPSEAPPQFDPRNPANNFQTVEDEYKKMIRNLFHSEHR